MTSAEEAAQAFQLGENDSDTGKGLLVRTSMFFRVLSMRTNLVLSAVAAVVAVCCGASLAHAAAPSTLVDSEGFNAPTFSAGSLSGQNGWSQAGSGSSATIEAGMGPDGTQAVHLNRGPDSNAWWGATLSNIPGGGSNILRIQWDMSYELLEQADHPNSFGPFFGVQAFDDVTIGGTVLSLATLGVDVTTRDILVADGVSGAFKETGFLLTHDDWHNFELVLNFNNSTYTAFVDGDRLAQEGFVDDAAVALSDASLAALAAAGDMTSQELVGNAFIDNFTIVQGLAADFDDDGDVNGDDLSIWEGAFGATDAGDANGDGNSDGNDFLIWQRQVGTDLTSPPAVAAAAGVPEPSAAALALLALAGLGAGCRRLKSR